MSSSTSNRNLFAVGGGCVCALAAPVLLGSVASYAGFTSAGIAAGSGASAWMSSIALSNGVGVASGSWYAMMQSVAMTGAYSPVCSAVGAIGGAALGVLLGNR